MVFLSSTLPGQLEIASVTPSASIWAPCLVRIRAAIDPAALIGLALHLRDPFLGFYTELASDDLPACAKDYRLTRALAASLDVPEPARFAMLSASAPDLLLCSVAGTSHSGMTWILLPFPAVSAEWAFHATVLIALHPGSQLTAEECDRAFAVLDDFGGLLELTLALRRTQIERAVSVGHASSSCVTSVLSALVPDAFEPGTPLLAGCTILEGRAELNNSVVFERAVSAVSPKAAAAALQAELELWSFGRPGTLFGLGTKGDPKFVLGRTGEAQGLGLFALDADGNASTRVSQLLQKDLPVRRQDSEHAGSLDAAIRQMSSHADRRAGAERQLSDWFNDNLPISSNQTRGNPQEALWCLTERREQSVLTQWHDAPGLIGGFTVVGDELGRRPLQVRETSPWLQTASQELLHVSRSGMVVRALAVIVQTAVNLGDEVLYRVSAGRLRHDAEPANAIAVHGALLSDGVVLRLRPAGKTCDLEINRGAETIASQWEVRESYVPLASFSARRQDEKPRSISSCSLSYPPSETAIAFSVDERDLTPLASGCWTDKHRRALFDAGRQSLEILAPSTRAIVGVPLPHAGSPPQLDAAQWCFGSGIRRFMVAPIAGNMFDAGTVDLLATLRGAQDLAAPQINNTMSDVDKVLVDHLRHDLSTLRRNFEKVIESAMNPSPDEEFLLKSIRDVEHKLVSLETICTLYDSLEQQASVDLEILAASLEPGIDRGVVRARQKLAVPEQEDTRLRALVSYTPAPPSKVSKKPNRLAVLLLENVIGNAIYAAATSAVDGDERSAVEIEVREPDGELVVRNRANPNSWAFAQQQLQSTTSSSRGISVIRLAARIAQVRIVAGDQPGEIAELHLLPIGGQP